MRVNGIVAELGRKADVDKDQITLDGAPLPKSEPLLYVILNKPRGVLSTVNDPLGRSTVRDLIPLPGTLYPVGRLDEESEGLILLTNDRELTNRLTHPKFGHEKEYRVLVARRPDLEQIETWKRGVVLPEGYNAPAQVFLGESSGKGLWLKVIMKEGRKHQIREIGLQLGLRENKRDGKFLDVVGTYDPMRKPASVNFDAAKLNHWLGQGAEPTVTVRSLLKKHGAAPVESA